MGEMCTIGKGRFGRDLQVSFAWLSAMAGVLRGEEEEICCMLWYDTIVKCGSAHIGSESMLRALGGL